MKKETVFSGKLWVITNAEGQLIDDIDTDMIYHNAHLAVTDIDKMGQYAFGNLQGWSNFSTKAKPGDVVVVGKNFGSGSSRQHAVDCFSALGISAIIAESYGAIYKRNAINAGFPILSCESLGDYLKQRKLPHGSDCRLDLQEAALKDASSNELLFITEPFSKVQMDIYQAGNIFEFGRTLS